MKQTSKHQQENILVLKKEKFLILACLTTLVVLYMFHEPISNYTTYTINFSHQTISITPPNVSGTCDLFKGRWIQDSTSTLYTNYSCPTIPRTINCFLNGREDADFLNWRWKPDECELSRFSPEMFLSVVRGKTMAFIGDSLARNHMNSLLCLLSTVETPKAMHNDMEKDEHLPTDKEARFKTWFFPNHNFTMMTIWSQFLVSAKEQVINGTANGSFNLTLDKADTIWSNKLPIIDYAIFSDAHWFIRPHYLFESNNLIGCIYCGDPNLTAFGPEIVMRKAFRTAFSEISSCKNCGNIFTIMRTFAPQHFEHGVWNTGGRCDRTRHVEREEVKTDGVDWEYRKIQVDEIELARKLGGGNGNKFEVMDVTEMMMMRPDGHPDKNWGIKWMKGNYRDCVHWCLPGPIDSWNQLMLEVIRVERWDGIDVSLSEKAELVESEQIIGHVGDGWDEENLIEGKEKRSSLTILASKDLTYSKQSLQETIIKESDRSCTDQFLDTTLS